MVTKPRHKVLITGASGFLGARLFAFFQNLNAYDLYLGARNFSLLEKKFSILPSQKRHFQLDQPETFASAVCGMDTVVHLAALDFQACEKDPSLAQRLNVEATQILMQNIQQEKVGHIIYLSTFHVYGLAEGLITEETLPSPQNAYALTHLQAEHEILKSAAPNRKSIIRLSNSFGKPMLPSPTAYKLAINDFCKQAVQTGKIVIQSSGFQLRDFVSSNDLFYALDFLMNQSDMSTSAIYNVGSGQTVSVLEMAQLIQKICKEQFQQSVQIERLGDKPTQESQKKFIFSSEKIKSFGYKPFESLEVGLCRFLKELYQDKND